MKILRQYAVTHEFGDNVLSIRKRLLASLLVLLTLLFARDAAAKTLPTPDQKQIAWSRQAAAQAPAPSAAACKNAGAASKHPGAQADACRANPPASRAQQRVQRQLQHQRWGQAVIGADILSKNTRGQRLQRQLQLLG